MFRYNPKANYQPNGGQYLQILSGKDLYKQTIVVSAGTHDTFPARFLNVFVDYPLGQMRVGDKSHTLHVQISCVSKVISIVQNRFCKFLP